MKQKLMRKRSSAFALSAIAAAASTFIGGQAFAQGQSIPAPDDAKAADQQPMAEIVVTGSAIKRVDAETAVPLTVLNVDDLKAQGLTTVEQVIGTLSAGQSSLGTSQAVGNSTGGASFVDLRGIGANKTLILLNGRRIANSAFDSSAGDLNSIPMAAIERVEVLRDGASSLYGTDAIGGVINFITKKDYQGGTLTLGYDKPQHDGGESRNANIGFGYGDYDTQGFNIFAFGDFEKQNNISGTQRDFNGRFPGGLSQSPFPANFYQGDGSTIGNPAAADCSSGLYAIPGGDGTSCKMVTSKFVDYIPESERASGYLHGDFKLAENHKMSVEYSVTRSEVKTLIAPVPYGLAAVNPTKPDGTPNPYYPGNSGAAFTPNIAIDGGYDGSAYFGDLDGDGVPDPLTGPGYSQAATGCAGTTGCTLADIGLTSGAGTVNSSLQPGFVWVNWRDVPNGPRGDDNVTLQQRVVLSFDGTVGDWDYDAGLMYNHTKTDEKLISGYGSGDLIYEGILDGIINPFGAQDEAGTTYLDSAALPGTVQSATGKVYSGDARISNSDLGDWFNAGRPAAIAVGVEVRREEYLQEANYDYAFQVSASTGIDPNLHNEGGRNIYAAYTEFSIPLHKTLDLTLAGRYDRYQDFGSTTNPKVSLRWQPIRELVIRSAFSTGFRAPSLYELHSAQTYTNTGNISDPVDCSSSTPTYCDTQFVALGGGNEDLKPEKSKSFTLGFVAEPVKEVTFGADFYLIKLTNLVSYLDEQTLLDPENLSWSDEYIHRNSNGHLSTVTQVCPGAACGYLDERNQNLGAVLTDGIDFNAAYRIHTDYGLFNLAYNSTWVHRYNYQDYQTGPWNENVGAYVGSGPIFRWKHTMSLDWKRGPYSAGATGYLKSGYTDVVTSNDPDGHKVGTYATLDLHGGWEPLTGLDFVLGIRNVTDRDPPLSYQTQVFQSGYDPRFYDPTGRTFYIRGTYSF
ncbi:TonB-dependent receptor [Solimonas marina]|uniref:TonB-dependent receptor n=1 Tax=Solimonas marina TaxID=2714601 RepID=A0A969WB69_9GAMM|nr:TonB-dependent receptor [Solimonas marina]NKF23957.1 TonB-dependent receptor [Solimonas marina]